MTTTHPRIGELAATAIDGRLSSPEEDELARHLDDCEDCRRTARRLRDDAMALAVPLNVEPPPRIGQEVEQRLVTPPLDPDLVRTMRIAAAGLVIIVTVLAVVFIASVLGPR